MSTTPSTLSVNMTTKAITPSDPISIREDCTITLTGTGSLVAANMALVLLRKSTICANCTAFTGSTNAFTDTLDLNTAEMAAVFSGARDWVRREFDLWIYDGSGVGFIVRDKVAVENSPLRDDDTTPGSVSPITGSTTTWGNLVLKNGRLYVISDSDGLAYPFGAGGTGTGVHIDLGETGVEP